MEKCGQDSKSAFPSVTIDFNLTGVNAGDVHDDHHGEADDLQEGLEYELENVADCFCESSNNLKDGLHGVCS